MPGLSAELSVRGDTHEPQDKRVQPSLKVTRSPALQSMSVCKGYVKREFLTAILFEIFRNGGTFIRMDRYIRAV